MDFEKEYKRKALEPIVNYIESVMASYSKEELEARIKKALPEKESEDERIRKHCIWMLKGCLAMEDGLFDKEKVKADIAWLEKQKEQKPVEKSLIQEKGNEVMKAIEGVIRVYEKTQGGWIAGYDMDTLVIHLREAFNALEKQKEQKPVEWSEEDERMLNVIIYKMSQHQGNDDRSLFTPDEVEFIDGMEDKLKSLRPQPEQIVLPSLSEKEIICLKRALDYLRKEHNRYGGEDFTNEIVVLEWLITHPILVYSSQPSWKPSEEQMVALARATNRCAGVEDAKKLLKLLEQLESL